MGRESKKNQEMAKENDTKNPLYAKALKRVLMRGMAVLVVPLAMVRAEPKAASTGEPEQSSWGQPNDGLRTRLFAEKRIFRAGQPIPLKLEMENVGDQTKSFTSPCVPDNGTLIVVGVQGKKAPYIGGSSQVGVGPNKLDPGLSRELRSFDLAEWYYLRVPGRYTVKWPGEPNWHGEFALAYAPIPPSGEFQFEVVADPGAAADGDPVGRLLPLLNERWWLGAVGAKATKLHPGGNHQEVSGRLLTLQYNPTGYKVDAGLVWLWLTDQPAAEQHPTGDWPPPSEYLGKLTRWHVYFNASTNALRAWPAVKADLKRALSKKR